MRLEASATVVSVALDAGLVCGAPLPGTARGTMIAVSTDPGSSDPAIAPCVDVAAEPRGRTACTMAGFVVPVEAKTIRKPPASTTAYADTPRKATLAICR